MGRKMIKSRASEILAVTLPNGSNHDEVENYDIELMSKEASLDYLCNLSPHR